MEIFPQSGKDYKIMEKKESNKKYLSRKFIVALVLIGCTTYLAGINIMDGDNVMVVFGLVGAGYGMANVIGKKKEIT